MKTMKICLFSCLLLASAGYVAAATPEGLTQAVAAIEAQQYKSALKHLARFQAFEYEDAEWMPAALFYEAWVYQKTEALELRDAVLQELERFYPQSSWTQRAKQEFK